MGLKLMQSDLWDSVNQLMQNVIGNIVITRDLDIRRNSKTLIDDFCMEWRER